ncbi:MAG: M6 family metalloprotease domain-containing protein [Bacteroidaceae bacterium]|nr:M6 family metalloprotease domain-containing protein [Bacteroidaceae bacterium]
MKNLFLRVIIGMGALFCFTPVARAIMANPNPITVTQPDGSLLTIRIYGDESFHYTTTIDGYLIEKDKDGFFKYIDTTTQKPLQLIANNIDARTTDEVKVLSQLAPAKRIIPQWVGQRVVGKKSPRVTPPTSARPLVGQKRAAEETAESQYLVILVGFSDRPFTFTNNDFDKWLNEKGYSVDGGTGSVKDYYRDNSMGQFIPNFTVLGPYTLPYTQLYYAGNSEDTGEDANPRAMIVDACNIAKAQNPDIDFSIFDNNKDGYMDNVNVVYAGYSEASTGNGDDMWPHSWTLDEFSLTIDGIIIDAYVCSAEFVGAEGEKMDGIGTFTHEFGHVLGLKDMYDTDEYTDGYGLDPGDYSIFASGSYNNESRTPPCLMAFERMQMGWCNPVELKDVADISLNPISENVAYYINAQPNRAEGTGHEWFILENRQKTGWDTYLPAHGLLIYHYDYTDEMVEKYWSVNGPNNNSKHRCMYIKPADGIDDTNTRNGDTYPGRSGNTEFTDNSTPNALSWAGEKTNTPITNIREEEGVIYFQVKGGIENLSIIYR